MLRLQKRLVTSEVMLSNLWAVGFLSVLDIPRLMKTMPSGRYGQGWPWSNASANSRLPASR